MSVRAAQKNPSVMLGSQLQGKSSTSSQMSMFSAERGMYAPNPYWLDQVSVTISASQLAKPSPKASCSFSAHHLQWPQPSESQTPLQ